MRLRSALRFAKRAAVAILSLCIVLAIAVTIFITRCAKVERPPKVQSEASRNRQKFTSYLKDYARAEDSS